MAATDNRAPPEAEQQHVHPDPRARLDGLTIHRTDDGLAFDVVAGSETMVLDPGQAGERIRYPYRAFQRMLEGGEYYTDSKDVYGALATITGHGGGA